MVKVVFVLLLIVVMAITFYCGMIFGATWMDICAAGG